MRLSLTLTVTALVLAACGQQPHPSARGAAPTRRAIEALPGGDFAGGVPSNIGDEIRNPLEGLPGAIAAGKQLFIQMNCAGCHGYDLGGSMGPNLTDTYWRYGGSAAAIYRSIADGHPQGMPAWRRAVPSGEIWKLTAYIQSFGGGTPAAGDAGSAQGDYAAKPTGKGVGTGAQSGAKGASAPSAQSPNP